MSWRGGVILVSVLLIPAVCWSSRRLRSSNRLWSQTADSLRAREGQTVKHFCPPCGEIYQVYGSNPYTSTSTICSAAVHAGLITLERGGMVEFKVQAFQETYKSTYRNGVQSGRHTTPKKEKYRRHARSFIFPAARLNLPRLKDRDRSTRTIRWTTTLRQNKCFDRRAISFRCRPGGKPGRVWGNNPYTSTSSICGAAVHAGVIKRNRGGVVWVEPSFGMPRFHGNHRNGVTSRAHGPWGSSFTFEQTDPDLPGTRPPRPGPRANPWKTTGRMLRYLKREEVKFACPPGGKPGPVWGNNPYSSDSSVCTAAVHAGLIMVKGGGEVKLEIRDTGSFSRGNTRNGVTSRRNSSSSSFFFRKPGPYLEGPPTPPIAMKEIHWLLRAKKWRDRAGERFAFSCYPGGWPMPVIGSNPYSIDSSICTAAVHAGLITMKKGGPVLIEITGGNEGLPGTYRNGVTSNTRGRHLHSFFFPDARRNLSDQIPAR